MYTQIRTVKRAHFPITVLIAIPKTKLFGEAARTQLDSEGEEIMKDITELDAEGPAKPRHSNRTVALWKREAEFWEQ